MISTPSSCVNVVFCCKDWTGQYYFALLFILLTTSILHKGMDFINYFKVVTKNLISPSLNKGPEAPQSYLHNKTYIHNMHCCECAQFWGESQALPPCEVL